MPLHLTPNSKRTSAAKITALLFLCLLLTAAFALWLLVFPNSTTTPGPKTPQEAFDKIVAAASRDDFQGLMDHLTTDSQEAIIGHAAVLAAFLANAEDDGRLRKILADHHVNLDEATQANQKFGRHLLPALKHLAAKIKDGPAFVDKVHKILKEDRHLVIPAGILLHQLKNTQLDPEIKIEGNKALATLQSSHRQVHFVRTHGTWKIDFIPLFDDGVP